VQWSCRAVLYCPVTVTILLKSMTSLRKASAARIERMLRLPISLLCAGMAICVEWRTFCIGSCYINTEHALNLPAKQVPATRANTQESIYACPTRNSLLSHTY
jgi:hypothetical protein